MPAKSGCLNSLCENLFTFQFLFTRLIRPPGQSQSGLSSLIPGTATQAAPKQLATINIFITHEY